jgi:hypothetical protein
MHDDAHQLHELVVVGCGFGIAVAGATQLGDELPHSLVL